MIGRRLEVTTFICLLVATVLIWLSTHGKWSPRSWKYPVGYTGDSLYELGIIRAASHGWYLPLRWKIVPTLGAPNGASWNDYPHTEDFHYATFGFLAALFGLMPAANLALLIAYVLNGASFYIACRLLRYRQVWSFVGAIVFAFSHYAASRGLIHLELLYYGHLPLAVVVTWWVAAGVIREITSRRAMIAFAIMAWSGIQNAYYTYLLGQLLLFALLVNLARGNRRRDTIRTTAIAGALILTLAAGFLVGNVDSISYRWQHGANAAALARSYTGAEVYALKPIELFLSIGTGHPMSELAQKYVREAFVRGEMAGPYLGWVGIVALISLIVFIFVRSARSGVTQARLPNGTWQLVWVFFLSVVGGVNCMAALVGLDQFRAMNRYTIVILTIVLLFLVRLLCLISRRWKPAWQIAVAAGIVAVSLVDLKRSTDKESRGPLRERVDSDRAFATVLEQRVPRGAAIFQLPVADYPEQGAIARMTDYEPLRPFLYTESIRFSYGDDKGRDRTLWQKTLNSLSPDAMVRELRARGFTAVLIDRDGYDDAAAHMVEEFHKAGARTLADAPRGDFILLQLP